MFSLKLRLCLFVSVSVKDSEITEEDNSQQFVTTPSLITAICTLLTNLISVDRHNVIRQFYEHSIDKYLFGCVHDHPDFYVTFISNAGS